MAPDHGNCPIFQLNFVTFWRGGEVMVALDFSTRSWDVVPSLHGDRREIVTCVCLSSEYLSPLLHTTVGPWVQNVG